MCILRAVSASMCTISYNHFTFIDSTEILGFYLSLFKPLNAIICVFCWPYGFYELHLMWKTTRNSTKKANLVDILPLLIGKEGQKSEAIEARFSFNRGKRQTFFFSAWRRRIFCRVANFRKYLMAKIRQSFRKIRRDFDLQLISTRTSLKVFFLENSLSQ